MKGRKNQPSRNEAGKLGPLVQREGLANTLLPREVQEVLTLLKNPELRLKAAQSAIVLDGAKMFTNLSPEVDNVCLAYDLPSPEVVSVRYHKQSGKVTLTVTNRTMLNRRVGVDNAGLLMTCDLDLKGQSSGLNFTIPGHIERRLRDRQALFNTYKNYLAPSIAALVLRDVGIIGGPGWYELKVGSDVLPSTSRDRGNEPGFGEVTKPEGVEAPLILQRLAGIVSAKNTACLFAVKGRRGSGSQWERVTKVLNISEIQTDGTEFVRYVLALTRYGAIIESPYKDNACYYFKFRTPLNQDLVNSIKRGQMNEMVLNGILIDKGVYTALYTPKQVHRKQGNRLIPKHVNPEDRGFADQTEMLKSFIDNGFVDSNAGPSARLIKQYNPKYK